MDEILFLRSLVAILVARLALSWLCRRGIARPDEAWRVFLQVVIGVACSAAGALFGIWAFVVVPGAVQACGSILRRAGVALRCRGHGRVE